MNAYCDSSKGACVDCTNFSRFHFGQPFQLAVPLPGTGSARFPRLSPTDGTMYLSYTQGTSTLLATAGYQSFPTWGAAMLLTSPPNPASTSNADVLGPLFLSDGTVIHDLDPSIPSGAVLLFDAPATLSAGLLRKVFAYPANSGQTPVQLSLPGLVGHDERVADRGGAGSAPALVALEQSAGARHGEGGRQRRRRGPRTSSTTAPPRPSQTSPG